MGDTEKRYNNVLNIIDQRLIPNDAAKKARGEVFTPLPLVREMLFGLRKSALEAGRTEVWGVDEIGACWDNDSVEDRVGGIPLPVWRDPATKWLDPANGIGNFPVVAFYMLDFQLGEHGPAAFKGEGNKKKRRKHIVENMLFMIELNKGNVNTARKIFEQMAPGAKSNICCADSLTMTDAKLMDVFGVNRFDVVMGNPPFNPPKTETGSSGNSIWQNFVVKYETLLNEDGYLSFVHPPGWKKPTDEIFRPEKFADGDYTRQIRQGQVWQVLKDLGVFKFICTNDQRSKTIGNDFLEHFPAVDYYVYQKSGDRSGCDTKNVFLGKIEHAKGVRLNYNLKYLPNLITKQTQDILHKITSKEGEKPNFGIYRDKPSEFFIEPSKGKYKYIYTYNKKSEPQYKYSDNLSKDDNINMDKVIMNYDGGIDSFTIQYANKQEKIGSFHMTMYSKVESDKDGKLLEAFFKSDIVKFIFLITQYASGKMTKNEPLVANSITIPPEEITDYYDFFELEEHKEYIEAILAHYETFKGPKRAAKTEKKPRVTSSERRTAKAAKNAAKAETARLKTEKKAETARLKTAAASRKATSAKKGGARRSKYGATRKARRH